MIFSISIRKSHYLQCSLTHAYTLSWIRNIQIARFAFLWTVDKTWGHSGNPHETQKQSQPVLSSCGLAVSTTELQHQWAVAAKFLFRCGPSTSWSPTLSSKALSANTSKTCVKTYTHINGRNGGYKIKYIIVVFGKI